MFTKVSLEIGVLRRCRDLLGGLKQLARRLHIPERDLQMWLTGEEKPTTGAFLSAVDLLIEMSDLETLERLRGTEPDATAAEGQAIAPSDTTAEQPVQPRTRRVLVVDDHVDTAQSITKLLAHVGHQVKYATDGRSALSLAREFRPEVVILDMLLPDMNGADLSRLLRLVHAKPIRVVAITGSKSERVREQACHAGCDEFMVKPVHPNRLEELIAKQSP